MWSCLVARGNTAEVRDLVDEAFDEMAFLVEMAIERRARCMGRIGSDHGGDGTAREMVAEGAGIEGTVDAAPRTRGFLANTMFSGCAALSLHHYTGITHGHRGAGISRAAAGT